MGGRVGRGEEDRDGGIRNVLNLRQTIVPQQNDIFRHEQAGHRRVLNTVIRARQSRCTNNIRVSEGYREEEMKEGGRKMKYR